MSYRIFLVHGTARINKLLIGDTSPEVQLKWMKPLSDYLESEIKAHVWIHNWSGRLLAPWQDVEINKCAESLENFFKNIKGETIQGVIMAKSNGAQLVENALNRLSIQLPPPQRLIEIRLATPLRGSKLHSSRFSRRYRLLSKSDTLYRFGGIFFRMLYPKSDYPDSDLVEIELKGYNHHDFNFDNSLISEFDASTTSLFALYPIILSKLSDNWLKAGFRKAQDQNED